MRSRAGIPPASPVPPQTPYPCLQVLHIQPVLVELHNVGVIHQHQLLKHGLDLLLGAHRAQGRCGSWDGAGQGRWWLPGWGRAPQKLGMSQRHWSEAQRTLELPLREQPRKAQAHPARLCPTQEGVGGLRVSPRVL